MEPPMELTARLYPLDYASRACLAELLVPLPPAVSARFPVPVSDPRLPRISAAGDSAAGNWVSAEAVLSRRELKAATHFEAVCRFLIRETDRDREANMATVTLTPVTQAGGFEAVRLTRGFVLSRIRMKPNVIGLVGDWTGEYVVGAALAQALSAAGCSGYTLLPVTDPETGSAGSRAAARDCNAIGGRLVSSSAIVNTSLRRHVTPALRQAGFARATPTTAGRTGTTASG